MGGEQPLLPALLLSWGGREYAQLAVRRMTDDTDFTRILTHTTRIGCGNGWLNR